MPASAVPSEEAFSGGQCTYTWEQNALGPELISSLQIIKSFLVSWDQREEKDSTFGLIQPSGLSKELKRMILNKLIILLYM